jgi:hypothetical protein
MSEDPRYGEREVVVEKEPRDGGPATAIIVGIVAIVLIIVLLFFLFGNGVGTDVEEPTDNGIDVEVDPDIDAEVDPDADVDPDNGEQPGNGDAEEDG